MNRATKDQTDRERRRDYEAALSAARSPVAVLVMFAQGRERRSRGESLEVAFAAAPVEGVEDGQRLPAAVWVTLRQGDVDATVAALLRASRRDVVVAAHEELDAGYRLTTVEERRPLPDVEALTAQVAALLRIPRDVVEIITTWGPDDPRSAVEIEALLGHRFGPVPSAGEDQARLQEIEVAERVDEADPDPASPDPEGAPVPLLTQDGPRAGLVMSSTEFTALLNLTPGQRAVLGVLVRQADLTISADLTGREPNRST